MHYTLGAHLFVDLAGEYAGRDDAGGVEDDDHDDDDADVTNGDDSAQYDLDDDEFA